MFKVNEYFDGNVKSVAFTTSECPATIGVMAAGEYEFGTATVEYMTITSGILHVLLPGETTWNAYEPFSTFVVAKGVKFRVKAEGDVSYLCLYK